MTKIEFIKQLSSMFAEKGFTCKSKHFYKEISRDVLIVFGIHMSLYGEYCYLEYGYCFKTINKYLPFPKFNQLNLNCGRIMTNMGKAIIFEEIDEKAFIDIEKAVDTVISSMIKLINMGRSEMIQYYLSGQSNQSWYILGNETANYFGLPKEAFLYHFVEQ